MWRRELAPWVCICRLVELFDLRKRQAKNIELFLFATCLCEAQHKRSAEIEGSLNGRGSDGFVNLIRSKSLGIPVNRVNLAVTKGLDKQEEDKA